MLRFVAGLLLSVSLIVYVEAQSCDQYQLASKKGTEEARIRAEKWILSHRDNKTWGWAYGDTHRALLTLYLSNQTLVRNNNLETQLSIKQLELELALQLQTTCDKYGTPGSLSLGQLALFVQALLAVGKRPENFYGRNLVECVNQPLRKQPSPFAYALTALAYCNAGGTVTKDHVTNLLNTLNRTATLADTPAMAALAVICAQKKSPAAQTVEVHKQLNSTLVKFMKSQKSDGSFGNIDTSALVVQALVAAKDFRNGWNYKKAIDYLLSQQSDDGAIGGYMLATYEALPLLSNHTFVDLTIPY